MLPPGPWGTLSLQLCLPRPPVAAGLADGWMSPALNRSSCGGRRMDAVPRAAGLIPDPPTREHGVGESPGASDSGRLRLDFRRAVAWKLASLSLPICKLGTTMAVFDVSVVRGSGCKCPARGR